MKSNLNRVLSFLAIIFIIVLNLSFVNASSFEFIAKAQKEVFKPGEDIVIDMVIDNIDAGKEGINVVETSLEYNKEIFETMEFITKNNWNYDYNDDESSNKFKKLLFTNISSGITEKQSIGNIKFKLKSNLPDMETKIILKQVTSNDGKELMNLGDRVVTIKIENDKKEDEPKEDEPKGEPKDDESKEEPKDDESKEEPKDDEQKSESKTTEEKNKEEQKQVKEESKSMPQTGQTRLFYIIVGSIIGVLVFALITIIIFANKKKDDNKK